MTSRREGDATSDIVVNRFAFKVFGGEQYDNQIGFKVCNYSSFCFYVIQAIYAIYLLYQLCHKTERKPKRSRSLISAVAMILYSSVMLSCLFGFTNFTIKAQNMQDSEGKGESDIYYDIYLIMCRDLPFSLTFIAH